MVWANEVEGEVHISPKFGDFAIEVYLSSSTCSKETRYRKVGEGAGG